MYYSTKITKINTQNEKNPQNFTNHLKIKPEA